MAKTSLCLVHDTGTGKVTGFGLQGREQVEADPRAGTGVAQGMDGWTGLDTGSASGGTDHLSFERAGRAGLRVPARTWPSTA